MDELTCCNDDLFMREALGEAAAAGDCGEVPVGCVIVCDGKIIARGRNRREANKSALAHAELEALEQACRVMGGWRLFMCDLYVTLEPCPMCAGAIMNSRIRRVIFGAGDPKAGAYGGVFDLNGYPVNHKPLVIGGVLGDECASLLSDFFGALRNKTPQIRQEHKFTYRK